MKWAIPRKNQTGGWGEGWGVEDMEFAGYQRNRMRNFQRLTKNEVEFPPKCDQEKIMRNFQGRGLWPWNFPEIKHNFVEFSGVK